MKKILTLTVLLVCANILLAQEAALTVSGNNAVQSAASASLRFGYLSYNDVLHAMPEYERAMKSLDELRSTYEQEMQRAEQEFSKKFTEYLDGQKSFPENIMLKRQKELQQLMQQSLQFKSEAEDRLQEAERELLEPVREALNEAIRTVGNKQGYAYVLNTDANAYPYISGDGMAEDCTDMVAAQLGIK